METLSIMSSVSRGVRKLHDKIHQTGEEGIRQTRRQEWIFAKPEPS
jgi:hypothetical protein